MTGTDAGAGQRQAEQWTTRRLLAWMGEAFAKKGLDSPRLCAEMLMAGITGTDRLKLYTDPDRPASDEELARLRGLVKRALQHEPIQYLVGEAWFFGLPFAVDKRVLVPRPSTETIVETVLQDARARHGAGVLAGAERKGLANARALVRASGEEDEDGAAADPAAGPELRIADVCTGSGCIAVALAKHLPTARIVATDLSADALEVARANAERHGIDGRLTFAQGDLLAPLREHAAEGSLAYLVSNPPYIPDDEWADVEPNVKNHEPTMALRAGRDGLDLIRPLVEQAPPLLAAGGLLLIEHAASHAEAVRTLAERHPLLTNARTLKDIEGHPRVLAAERRP